MASVLLEHRPLLQDPSFFDNALLCEALEACSSHFAFELSIFDSPNIAQRNKMALCVFDFYDTLLIDVNDTKASMQRTQKAWLRHDRVRASHCQDQDGFARRR